MMMTFEQLPQKVHVLEGETYGVDGQEYIMNGDHGSSFYYECIQNGQCVLYVWSDKQSLQEWQIKTGHSGNSLELDKDRLILMLKGENRIQHLVFNPEPKDGPLDSTQCIPLHDQVLQE